jgi:hypothetical protein
MKVSAITICKNYDDFLSHTLPRNVGCVDELFVVTHHEDTKTQELCAAHPTVHCIVDSEAFGGATAFNKGRAINSALNRLGPSDWILHIDADIILPSDFRSQIQRAEIEQCNIYGAERCRILGFDAWEKWKGAIESYGRSAVEGDSSGYLLRRPKECIVDARFINHRTGYFPLGYFQLWHSSCDRRYPSDFNSADRSDDVFAQQWPRARRVLLPEFHVYHLDSEAKPTLGVNWRGRVTPRFEDAGVRN